MSAEIANLASGIDLLLSRSPLYLLEAEMPLLLLREGMTDDNVRLVPKPFYRVLQ